MSKTSFDVWTAGLDERAAQQAASGDDTAQRISSAFAKHYQAERDRVFTVPEQIVHARKAHGLTQAQLAQLAGVDQSAISRLECGQINASLDTVAKVSKPLGLHLALVDTDGHIADGRPVA